MKHAGWLLPVAKRRRGLGTSPQAGGLGDEFPHRFPLSRSDLEKSSQGAKRNLTVDFRKFFRKVQKTQTPHFSSNI